MKDMDIKKGLRFWFTVHFAADTAIAIPLMIFPTSFLTFLGWQTVDPVSARLVAAALFGIGIESLLGRNAETESFETMLNLKIIWSIAAIAGFIINLATNVQGNPPAVWAFLGIFTAFNLLWIYWRKQIS